MIEYNEIIAAIKWANTYINEYNEKTARAGADFDPLEFLQEINEPTTNKTRLYIECSDFLNFVNELTKEHKNRRNKMAGVRG